MPALAIPAAVAGAAAVVTGLGYAFARRVVGTRSRLRAKVIEISEHDVVLAATPKTLHPGRFGLWTPTDHLLVGDVTCHDERRKRVTRSILARNPVPEDSSRNIWEGDVFHSPEAIGPASDVSFPGPDGTHLPAWRIGPSAERWAIHIHGIRANRINALRTVPALVEAGYTSLVVSYRGDNEGPRMNRDAATLGLTEWKDIEAAIAYARSNGATKIVLIGWSMGASLALLAAEHAADRALVSAAVLISPALEWRQTITRSATRMGLPLPSACSALAQFFLSRRPFSDLVGLSRPIDFRVLDWTRPERIRIPTLIIHSPGDRTVPLEVSHQVAEANPQTVTLHLAPTADHAWEYNVAPEKFTKTISQWLARR
ncbi:alpha/beta hydrolase family protein [Microbacterium amylolyticum]|uniref:Dienelactone hydrolase n=1 Tax=Microbacterium amylolyticum TaxID=936337 RepID=A0ABS4ZKS2_9MICO|nr:alpha/beta fold hydrolase [Microbacterium amylolyticum]MBP2437893.1 dienelactone hydrolase [Microbacterium amylolyticum]